jgi:hypothetical protein
MKIQLRNVRLSFPHLFEATSVEEGGQKSFSANFLIAADDPQADAVNDAIEAAAVEKWEKKATGILAALRGKDMVCLHNGDMKADMEGYAGNYYLSARSQMKPLVIDKDKTVLTQQAGRPYSGCYVNASIEIYAQDNKWGKRVNASLKGVQFLRDGDAFAGGAPASPDEFDDVSDVGADDLA